MALRKKEIHIRKMNQRLESLRKTNPKMAKNLEGKIAAFKGKKVNS